MGLEEHHFGRAYPDGCFRHLPETKQFSLWLYSLRNNIIIRFLKYCHFNILDLQMAYKYPLIAISWSLNTMKLIKSMASTRRNGFHQKECTPPSLSGIHPVYLGPKSNFSEHFFFEKHVWMVTAFAKYHSFSLLCRPHQQNINLELGYALIIFKYFQSKHCELLVNSCFWKS